MATGISILDRTYIANADLSARIYCLVKKDTTGDGVVLAGAGDPAIGVLQNKPISGAAAIVRVAGTSPVQVGAGNLAEGDLVMSAANGLAVTGSAGNYVVAVAETAGTNAAGLATILLRGLCKI